MLNATMVLVADATPEQCAAAARRRRRAAAAYRPERVRFLLTAQTPPEELDRYFVLDAPRIW